MSSEGDIAPRRLHPAGIAVLGVGALRGLALPLGVAFAGAVLGAGGSGGGQALSRAVLFGLLGAALAAAAGVAGWLTTRWSVGEDTIRLRTGVIATREIDVPLSRVQAIDTVHGPLQRLFGVRGVQVQTAGGGRDSEIALPAVSPADVELLGAALRRRRGDDLALPEAPPAPAIQRRLGRRDLLLAALTSGQIGVILPALAVVPQLLGEVWGGDLQSAERESLRVVPDTAPEWIAAVLALVLLAWLLSCAGTVVAFAGFSISRDDDRLRIRRGLIAHREATVPVGRVQAVRVVEGLLRAPFGLLTVRAEVAGYAREEPAAQTLFPLLRRAEAEAFLRTMLPELADDLGPLEAPPRRALRRYVLPPLAAWVAVGGAVAVAVPAAAPWTLPVAALAATLGVARWRAAGWRIRGGRVAVRSRRLARVTVLAPAARLQEHGVRQTVLQQRAGLADLEVRVGASTHGRVRHLEARDAGRAFDALR
jgi:putative membrane protein